MTITLPLTNMTRQSKAKAPFYRPEYALYLNREMIVANAWQHVFYLAKSVRIDNVVSATVKVIQQQARTGRFPYYFIPAREEPRYDPLYYPPRGIHDRPFFGVPYKPT